MSIIPLIPPDRWARLPHWVQAEIDKRNVRILELENALMETRAAHAVLGERSWFTLNGPTINDMLNGETARHLWLLDHDKPFPVCQLGHGDTLLIGRAIKPGEDIL